MKILNFKKPHTEYYLSQNSPPKCSKQICFKISVKMRLYWTLRIETEQPFGTECNISEILGIYYSPHFCIIYLIFPVRGGLTLQIRKRWCSLFATNAYFALVDTYGIKNLKKKNTVTHMLNEYTKRQRNEGNNIQCTSKRKKMKIITCKEVDLHPPVPACAIHMASLLYPRPKHLLKVVCLTSCTILSVSKVICKSF